MCTVCAFLDHAVFICTIVTSPVHCRMWVIDKTRLNSEFRWRTDKHRKSVLFASLQRDVCYTKHQLPVYFCSIFTRYSLQLHVDIMCILIFDIKNLCLYFLMLNKWNKLSFYMKRCLTRCKMFCLLTYNRYCFGHCLLDWYSCFWHRSGPEETFKLQKCFFFWGHVPLPLLKTHFQALNKKDLIQTLLVNHLDAVFRAYRQNVLSSGRSQGIYSEIGWHDWLMCF